MKSQSDIDTELGRLGTLLPGLVAELPTDKVLEAFAEEAKALTEHAPEEQRAYVTHRINCLLSSAGLIPGETEGEPCPTGV